MTLYNRCPEFSARCRRAKAWPRRAALVLLSWACATLWANDGTYYTSGNQLLPLVETDIRVQREVLTLTWGEDLVAEVDVQYEFFNPGARKTVLMGFEADYPRDGIMRENDGGHPNITGFTVVMNDKSLPVRTALVVGETQLDAQGNIRAFDLSRYGNDKSQQVDSLWVHRWAKGEPVAYVYHFEATFEPGVNVVHHRYRYLMKQAVYCHYGLDYKLSPALRWANRQIDDFTLRIRTRDVPLHFMMEDSLFRTPVEPVIEGTGKWRRRAIRGAGLYGDDPISVTEVFLRDATVEFRATNYRPGDELRLFAADCTEPGDIYEISDYYAYRYPLIRPTSLSNDLYRRVRNLPFAHRGYVFKDRGLNDFFRNRWWYIPDDSYQATVESLTPGEQEWLRNFDREAEDKLKGKK